jgi:ketosteroid isomerase-like protein
MSDESVELVRRALEEWNRGERSEARVRAFWHPDVEFLPRRSATEGPYRGIEGVERFIADTEETFERFEQHYEVVDLGERVLVSGQIHVRARGSGIETDVPAACVLEFRDGKIVRWEDFGSKDKALEALGLQE